jgi:hypothetical protein
LEHMHNPWPRLQRPLSRRLMPLAYGLVLLVGTIVLMTWFALKAQVTLAGFLNSESVWSKAQKQAVIALQSFAVSGQAEDLRDFESNYTLLESDRLARDEIASGHFDRAAVDKAFVRGSVMPSAQSGMIFMLQHVAEAPHFKEALAAWRSTDSAVAELAKIAEDIRQMHSSGPVPAALASQQLDRIQTLNNAIGPHANLFSLCFMDGADAVHWSIWCSLFGHAAVAGHGAACAGQCAWQRRALPAAV